MILPISSAFQSSYQYGVYFKNATQATIGRIFQSRLPDFNQTPAILSSRVQYVVATVSLLALVTVCFWRYFPRESKPSPIGAAAPPLPIPSAESSPSVKPEDAIPKTFIQLLQEATTEQQVVETCFQELGFNRCGYLIDQSGYPLGFERVTELTYSLIEVEEKCFSIDENFLRIIQVIPSLIGKLNEVENPSLVVQKTKAKLEAVLLRLKFRAAYQEFKQIYSLLFGKGPLSRMNGIDLRNLDSYLKQAPLRKLLHVAIATAQEKKWGASTKAYALWEIRVGADLKKYGGTDTTIDSYIAAGKNRVRGSLDIVKHWDSELRKTQKTPVEEQYPRETSELWPFFGVLCKNGPYREEEAALKIAYDIFLQQK